MNLLLGSDIQVWASGSDGKIERFQSAGRIITKACGCIAPEAYSIYGVKGAEDGILLLMDKKGKIHRPVEPCTKGSFRSMIELMASMSNTDPKARRVYAFWGLPPSEVESGYFINLGDTTEVRRP